MEHELNCSTACIHHGYPAEPTASSHLRLPGSQEKFGTLVVIVTREHFGFKYSVCIIIAFELIVLNVSKHTYQMVLSEEMEI